MYRPNLFFFFAACTLYENKIFILFLSLLNFLSKILAESVKQRTLLMETPLESRKILVYLVRLINLQIPIGYFAFLFTPSKPNTKNIIIHF